MDEFVLAGLLAIPVGAMVGLLGGGGSILMVPLLVYGLGLPDKEAIATSLLLVTITSAVASISYARNGNVMWKVAAFFGAWAMLGAFAGGRVARLFRGRSF